MPDARYAHESHQASLIASSDDTGNDLAENSAGSGGIHNAEYSWFEEGDAESKEEIIRIEHSAVAATWRCVLDGDAEHR